MSHTLYATFANPEDAEKAAGALLDRGARAEDLSVVRSPESGFTAATEPKTIASNVETFPSSGEAGDPVQRNADISPSNDIATKTVQGTLIGVGIGAIVAIASLLVPGVGFVLGAGALASAIGGVAATAGTGAAVGAIVGYLREMGVEEDDAAEYGQAVESGGAVLAISVPSGDLNEATAETILGNHAATNVNRYAARGYVA